MLLNNCVTISKFINLNKKLLILKKYRKCQLPKLKRFKKIIYDPFNPHEKYNKCDVNLYKDAKKQHLHCKLLELSRDYELYLSLSQESISVSAVQEKCFVFSNYKQWLL